MSPRDGDDGATSGDRSRSFAERYPGLEALTTDPVNAQTAARGRLESYLTPREEHYIRNHHRTPTIDEEEWSVSLTGMVAEDAELSTEEIKCDYATESVVHVME